MQLASSVNLLNWQSGDTSQAEDVKVGDPRYWLVQCQNHPSKKAQLEANHTLSDAMSTRLDNLALCGCDVADAADVAERVGPSFYRCAEDASLSPLRRTPLTTTCMPLPLLVLLLRSKLFAGKMFCALNV